MSRKDPDLFEVKGNPSIWVRLIQRGHRSYGERDTRWHYIFSYNGKRYRGATGKLERVDAVIVATQEAEKVMNYRPHPAGGLTLKAAITKCLAARWPNEFAADERGETVNNESFSDAKGRLTAFATFTTDNTSLATLDFNGFVGMVQRYLTKRNNDGMSGRTIKNDQLVISALFSWLLKPDETTGARLLPQLEHNPANKDLLTMPEVETVVQPDLSDAERKALFAAARGSELWPVVVLCLGAGFRPKGACTSPWSKFDLERGQFAVMEKNKERCVPLSPWTWSELKAWHAAHAPAADAVVWPYHHDTAHDVLAKLRTKHGLSARTTLQALRRTADSILYAAGVTPQDAAQIMGHSVETATRHYVTHKNVTRATVAALDFTEKRTVTRKVTRGRGEKTA